VEKHNHNPLPNLSLTHARHDSAHCLAPGLFRSLKRGERKKSKLDVVYHYGNGKRIEFNGPEPLGADDLRVLQGLVAMSGPGGLVLESEPESESSRYLRRLLEPKWGAIQQDALLVKGSYRVLAREIGYAEDGGSQFKTIRECIERLRKVYIIAQDGEKLQGFRLLSEYASDKADGRLYVALNPLIAHAVMGGRHAYIDMNEVRALRTGPSHIIHQRLCGWINLGKAGRIELDKICGYVSPDEAKPEAMKKRRQSARKSLSELTMLGWTVREYAKDKFEISRPSVNGTGVTIPKYRRNYPQVPA